MAKFDCPLADDLLEPLCISVGTLHDEEGVLFGQTDLFAGSVSSIRRNSSPYPESNICVGDSSDWAMAGASVYSPTKTYRGTVRDDVPITRKKLFVSLFEFA